MPSIIVTSGAGAAYNWQVSTDGGAVWNDVSPAATATPTTRCAGTAE